MQKDAECDFHGVAFLNAITNGEFIYAAFEIITETIRPNAATIELPTDKEAVLASILDGMAENFLDMLDTDGSSEEQAKGILRLYKSSCGIEKRETVAELKRDRWEAILETVGEAFLWPRDWESYQAGAFALDEKQPHWPTHQEFRTMKHENRPNLPPLLRAFIDGFMSQIPSSWNEGARLQARMFAISKSDRITGGVKEARELGEELAQAWLAVLYQKGTI